MYINASCVGYEKCIIAPTKAQILSTTTKLVQVSLSKASLKEMHFKDDPVYFRRFKYNHKRQRDYVSRVPTILWISCSKYPEKWNIVHVSKARTREIVSDSYK